MSNAILDANGGIESARALATAHHILSSHDLCQPVLYHIVLTGSQDIATYQAVIKSLIRRLRSKCRTEYFGAYEMVDNKGLHAHCFILIETSKKTPYKILDVNDGEYLHKLALRHKLEDKDGTKKRIHVSKPKNRMHQGQFFARPVGEELLADCMKWCSYEYKKRSKEGVQSRETYFNSEFKSNTTKRKAEKIAKGYVASTPPLDAPAANQEADVFIETPVFAAPARLEGVLTMSSVEIVDVINAMRGPGKAELRHDDFLRKLRTHPGIEARNFSGFYVGGNGKQEPCYYLPKREAELMVMSEVFPKSGESLEVQQPSNSTTSNTNNPFHRIGFPMGRATNHIHSEKESHEGRTTTRVCQANSSQDTGTSQSTVTSPGSRETASRANHCPGYDCGTGQSEGCISPGESRYSSTEAIHPGYEDDGPADWKPEAVHRRQSNGGASSQGCDTRQPISHNPGGTTVLTPAQNYIASRYEEAIGQQLDLNAVRAYLMAHGIPRTPAQVVYDLDETYGFYGYTASHPAPPAMTLAEIDKLLNRSEGGSLYSASSVSRTLRGAHSRM